jgi:hypothetical protein
VLTRNPKAATRRARSCHSSSVNDRPYFGAARRSSGTVMRRAAAHDHLPWRLLHRSSYAGGG